MESTIRTNILRRKTTNSMALPTLLTLYFMGACIAFTVCTRTFISFHVFSPEEGDSLNTPVLLRVQQEELKFEEKIQSNVHALRDVRSIAEAWNESSVEEPEEPEFMRQPVLRSNAANQAANLQDRLKQMTPWERRRWLAVHWSSFRILKEDSLSHQFVHRMQQFFCAGDSATADAVDVPSEDQMDEKKICGPRINTSPPGKLLCRQRFFLTWISPVSSFGPRERLCLESTFKWHPRACVVILSRTMDSSQGRHLLDPFMQRGFRVMAVTPDLPRLFASTPAAQWYARLRDGRGDPGCINLMQNLSNVMRLAALHRYGGIYLDTDVMVLKPMDGLRNAVGTQSHDGATKRWTRLNNAVLVFRREHPTVMAFVAEFAETFDGSRWGWNGPYLVSRVMERQRQSELQTGLLESTNCSSSSSAVSVLPLEALYPVNWVEVVRLFQRPVDAEQVKWQANELEWMRQGSYAIHLWNNKSNFLKVDKGSIMETLFKHSCLFCKVSRS